MAVGEKPNPCNEKNPPTGRQIIGALSRVQKWIPGERDATKNFVSSFSENCLPPPQSWDPLTRFAISHRGREIGAAKIRRKPESPRKSEVLEEVYRTFRNQIRTHLNGEGAIHVEGKPGAGHLIS